MDRLRERETVSSGGNSSPSGIDVMTRILMGSALATALALAGPAVAAEPSAPAARGTASGEVMMFDIPAQPLANALAAFRQQAGWSVSTGAASLAGLTSQPVRGQMAPAEALRTLLGTSGIVARPTGNKAAALEAAAGGDGAMVLSPVRVAGTASTDRPVEGYRAIRSTTATKTDTPLQDVPQSITVVSQEQVRDQGKRGLGEALEYVPGIKVGQGEGNRDQVTIRGNNSTADFFTNGIRDDQQYYRDTYNVDRIEALMGSNAMIFGRGGGGGVINRVLKEADGRTVREASLQGGSFGTKRATADVGQAIGGNAAARINALYENSGSFRDRVELERFGINPTISAMPTDRTKIKLSYEYFSDERTADRGIPSQSGKPYHTDISTFFGNPDLSLAEARNHGISARIEHEFANGISLRNHTSISDYDKFYQNVYANSAVSSTGTLTLGAYNNRTVRRNYFNQTDATADVATGPLQHKLLAGAEFGVQQTHNLRKTASNLTNVSALAPTVSNPFSFSTVSRNWDTTANIGAVYVQDQIDITRQWQLIGGLRLDRFDLDFSNNLTNQNFSRTDTLLSPRAGLVFKPVEPLSLYTSYSVSYLPGSGDQFDSLTSTTKALEPEEFTNYEIGAKWEVQKNLAATVAVYQLERTKTTATDSSGNTVQTGAQRSRGVELGLTGNVTPDWEMVAGYSFQNATITSTTSAATAGDRVYQVPVHGASLWNKYRFTEMFGAGLGALYQSRMYAAAGNTVSLPHFVRFDAALYAKLHDNLRAQLNVENLFDVQYYATAHNNNNISPGAPRTFLVSLTSNF